MSNIESFENIFLKIFFSFFIIFSLQLQNKCYNFIYFIPPNKHYVESKILEQNNDSCFVASMSRSLQGENFNDEITEDRDNLNVLINMLPAQNNLNETNDALSISISLGSEDNSDENVQFLPESVQSSSDSGSSESQNYQNQARYCWFNKHFAQLKQKISLFFSTIVKIYKKIFESFKIFFNSSFLPSLNFVFKFAMKINYSIFNLFTEKLIFIHSRIYNIILGFLDFFENLFNEIESLFKNILTNLSRIYIWLTTTF